MSTPSMRLRVTTDPSLADFAVRTTTDKKLVSLPAEWTEDATLADATVILSTDTSIATQTVYWENGPSPSEQPVIEEEEPFSPLDITNLHIWLDAPSLALANNAAVSSFTDKSGNARHAIQGTAANQPVYKTAIQNNLAVVRFAPTDFVDAAFASDLVQPGTLFLVGNLSGAATSQTIFDSPVNDSARRWFLRCSSTPTWQFYSGSTITGGAANGNKHIFLIRFNGASSRLFVDGGAANGSGNAGTGPTAGVRLGANPAGSTGLTGDVGEVALFSRALTVAEQNQMGTYLAERWGLTWTDVS